MRAEAEARGETWVGPNPFVVFYFDFDDEDRVACFMDFTLAVLVRGWDPAEDEQTARALAEEWASGDGHAVGPWVPFQNMPGIYAAAFFELITGQPQEPNVAQMMWALPSVGEYVPVRKYPPPVET